MKALRSLFRVNELLARIDALTPELDERETEVETSRSNSGSKLNQIWTKRRSRLNSKSIKAQPTRTATVLKLIHG